MILFLALQARNGETARDRILGVVRREPGIHTAGLVEIVKQKWSTVQYHLRILSTEEKIHLHREKREVRAFPPETPALHRPWLAALRDDDASKVIERLLSHPGQSVPQLGDALGLSHKVIRRLVFNLEESGLVVRRGELRPVFDAHVERVHSLPIGKALEPDHILPQTDLGDL